MAGKASIVFHAFGCGVLLECPIYEVEFVPRVGDVVFTPELIKFSEDLSFEDTFDGWTVESVWWDFADDAEIDATIWVTHPQYNKAMEAFNSRLEQKLRDLCSVGVKNER
jgi:hypothetical protein